VDILDKLLKKYPNNVDALRLKATVLATKVWRERWGARTPPLLSFSKRDARHVSLTRSLCVAAATGRRAAAAEQGDGGRPA
jgi:hypothetical protein